MEKEICSGQMKIGISLYMYDIGRVSFWQYKGILFYRFQNSS